jgi:Cu+-exporting ATPase
VALLVRFFSTNAPAMLRMMDKPQVPGSHDPSRPTDDSDRALARDPVCGVTVAVRHARATEYGGKTFYFCSAECKTKFEADPDRYVKKSA